MSTAPGRIALARTRGPNASARRSVLIDPGRVAIRGSCLSGRAATIAAKKSTRELGAGTVSSYIHATGQVGTLVLLSCETDFVSKHEDFRALAKDIAMHAAAMRPETKEILLGQSYIKDDKKTIADLIATSVQKFGGRIEVEKIETFSVS